jgi:hypothetical protein
MILGQFEISARAEISFPLANAISLTARLSPVRQGMTRYHHTQYGEFPYPQNFLIPTKRYDKVSSQVMRNP